MTMKSEMPSPAVFQRKISDFCRLRVEPLVSKPAYKNLKGYMLGLIIFRKAPPTARGRIDWAEIAAECDIEDEMTRELKKSVQPGLEAISRWLRDREREKERAAAARKPVVVAKPVPMRPVSANQSRPPQPLPVRRVA